MCVLCLCFSQLEQKVSMCVCMIEGGREDQVGGGGGGRRGNEGEKREEEDSKRQSNLVYNRNRVWKDGVHIGGNRGMNSCPVSLVSRCGGWKL